MGENMRLSKKIVIGIFTAAVLLSAVLLLAEGTVERTEDTPPSQKAETSVAKENYKVMAYDDKIAVFLEGNSTPLYTLDTPLVSELPLYDQELLKQGIIAETNSELAKILEDYDG